MNAKTVTRHRSAAASLRSWRLTELLRRLSSIAHGETARTPNFEHLGIRLPWLTVIIGEGFKSNNKRAVVIDDRSTANSYIEFTYGMLWAHCRTRSPIQLGESGRVTWHAKLIILASDPAILDILDLSGDQHMLVVTSRQLDGRLTARKIPPLEPLDDDDTMPLSEAFLGGYIGGLPKI